MFLLRVVPLNLAGRSFDLHENNNSEGTGSTTMSQEGRAIAARQATYHETKHRIKLSARTGVRFTQPNQSLQYLLQQGWFAHVCACVAQGSGFPTKMVSVVLAYDVRAVYMYIARNYIQTRLHTWLAVSWISLLELCFPCFNHFKRFYGYSMAGADPASICRVQRLNNERVDTFHQPFDDEDSQWPDGLQIDDLRSPGMEEDYRQRLSRHCVCFVSEAPSIMRGRISALLTTRGLAVSCREKVGHTKEGQSLVTVAFEQIAEARTVCQSEEIQEALFEHLGVLVRPLRLDRPSDRPNQDIDPARTVWFKNHFQIELSADDLANLAEHYGALARPGVVIKQYWNHRERVSVPTEVAFQGFIQFADRDGAQRLLADRRMERNHNLGEYYWNLCCALDIALVPCGPV